MAASLIMRQPKVKVRRYNERKRPHLKFVVNYREAGKRKRSFFETKRQADAFASFKNSELKQNGIEHAEFPSARRVRAQTTPQRLEPFGRTITDAVDHFVAHLEATEKSVTVTDFVPHLLSSKKGDCLSKRYIGDLSEKLFRVSQSFGGKAVASITAKEIGAWLRSLPVGPTT